MAAPTGRPTTSVRLPLEWVEAARQIAAEHNVTLQEALVATIEKMLAEEKSEKGDLLVLTHEALSTVVKTTMNTSFELGLKEGIEIGTRNQLKGQAGLLDTVIATLERTKTQI